MTESGIVTLVTAEFWKAVLPIVSTVTPLILEGMTTTVSDSTYFVIVPVGNKEAEAISYSEHNTGYTNKGVLFGSTNLNKYAANPANAGDYTFIFKDGIVNSAATGYGSIDNYKDTSVYMLVPGNSDVVFENMTLEQVQKATGLAEGFSDEKSSSNASIGLMMMKGGALRLCGFESKNGIIDRLTNENVADAAADMLSNNK